MRTLQEIEQKIYETAKDIADNPSLNDLSAAYRNTKDIQNEHEAGYTRSKFREMHSILELVEKYIDHPSLDGRSERQEFRNLIKKALSEL